MRFELNQAVIYSGSLVFFDKGQLVILINGFQKKSKKTPRKEIELAEKLKKQYYDEKDNK